MSKDNIWTDALESAFNKPTVLRASELSSGMKVKHKDAPDTAYTVTSTFSVEGGFDGLWGAVLESHTTGANWVIIYEPRTGKNNDLNWIPVEARP